MLDPKRLSVAILFAAWSGRAMAQDAVKPYFMTIVDNSGSMSGSTGGGSNSCAQPQTRMSDAKCVLQRIIDGYGDAVFGLGRYQADCSGTCAAVCDTGCGCTCSYLACNGCNNNGNGCPAGGASADQGEILVDLREDNQTDILKWIDFSCAGCDSGADPELSAETWTPIAGSLRAARRYYEGGDPTFPISPIATDPYAGCRPYSVILLTDGEETCASDAATNAAATELRSTTFGGQTYDIRTYVVGFGVTPGTQNIENIAASGGTDAPGPYRVYYATDETSLSLAFAQIIQDAILVEVCDNADNDCDGLIDEGFAKYCDVPGGVMTPTLCVDPGDPCDGVDDNCANGIDDEPVNACGGCGPAPTEVCDGADNDCDGFIDEPPGDCGGCVPQPEICDGLDNDCDGATDESLSRACGTDVGECTAGTQDCALGSWSACSGTGPTTEICDDLDNDCDGVTDGIAQPCGSSPDIGQCQPGSMLCVGGIWGPCTGEIGPSTEACDGADNDCDGETDEGDPGGGLPCEGDCGPGMTACIGGMVVCTGVGTGMPEECNGIDDDCNGLTDDGLPPMGPCDDGGALCLPGEITCVDGEWACVGGSPGEPESCDCEDNDCDGETDNGTGLCGPDGVCLAAPDCRCAQPCAPGEFPCPSGMICENDLCVPDPCANINCAPGLDGPRVCVDGECVPICEIVDCPAPWVCRSADGACVEDNCNGFPERCTEGQFCVDGACVDDPCQGVECGDEEFCRAGECVPSCADVTCPDGQVCDEGACHADPCADVQCPEFEVCDQDTLECVHDPCVARTCPSGEVCDSQSGECVSDPCLGVRCPATELCEDGNCWAPDMVGGGSGRQYVQIAGEGGCACAAGRSPQGAPWWPLLLLPLLRIRRRLRFAVSALLLALAGCQPSAFCVDCEVAPALDATVPPDLSPPDGIVFVPDACAPEICNGLDDDCNGLPDDHLVQGVGEPCGTDIGVCRPGLTVCVGGELHCGGDAREPMAESCNGQDDDCDGETDDGDPGGGGSCGTNVGECVRGTLSCQGGFLVCQGATDPVGELCDGLDNDCDGIVDDGDPQGGAPCLPMGACLPGALQCLGGMLQCVGAAAAAPELCDDLDNDCDGSTDEDFDLLSDPSRCGSCNTVCVVANGQPACVGGMCDKAYCFSGYWDANGDISDGCEYACDFRGTEICNGADDDCDGTTDVGLTPPSLCASAGECAGTTATCNGAGGWTCVYPPTVPTDPGGAILPESGCDGLDEDCDGVTDDAFPTLGLPCSRGVGGCTTTGAIACNATHDGVECTAADPPTGGAETCNGIDDNCDGATDEGAPDAWVQITGAFGTRWIYQFEASRPDATAASTGTMAHRPCAAPGRLPWTNVTYGEAQAACATVGAQLCTEAEWQRACETPAALPCEWSYASTCGAYDPDVCNGNDYDFDPMTTPDNEDGVLPAGSLPSCYADWGTPSARVFDLSGNVKEWTEARSTGVNPLRGGSDNNTAGGISCAFDFVVGDDDFQFDNVGFRCCRDTAP